MCIRDSVKIKIEPNEPGKGYEFVNAIVGGAIPKEYIPAIDNGIQGLSLIHIYRRARYPADHAYLPYRRYRIG